MCFRASVHRHSNHDSNINGCVNGYYLKSSAAASSLLYGNFTTKIIYVVIVPKYFGKILNILVFFVPQ